MKTQILSIDGKKIKEVDLPSVFSTKIREDIIKKCFETEKIMQPYGPHFMAGRHHSASGRIRHIRHKWGSAYGRGISRVPRKTMWRRGTQFYWIGAEISSARGGRRAHPPKVESMMKERKVNKKETRLAMKSAIASTSKEDLIKSRYLRLSSENIPKLPIIVESKFSKLKAKELVNSINSLLNKNSEVAFREKSIRSGKGKIRNRKYKKSAGVLIITGNKESVTTKMFDNKKVNELEIRDFYPLGRLVIYTEDAIKDLENFQGEKK